MPSPLAHLSSTQTTSLFEDLNYLNLKEFHGFCKQHSIPYKILVETPEGRRRVTGDTDRKPVVLARIRHYLRTGRVQEATCLSAAIVRADGPPRRLEATDRIYYRWYNKRYTGVLSLLEELTGGEFVDGAVARVLIMNFWTRAEAPTFEEFASAWSEAKRDEAKLLTPEYAYLTDLQRKKAGTDWKDFRSARARRALEILAQIPVA